MKLSKLALAVMLLASATCQADIKFSGYGSVVAGRTLGTVEDPLNPGTMRDEIFTADFYDVGQYHNDWTFKAESVFALQIVADIYDDLKVTAQMVAKGVDNFSPEFDWFYLTYQINPEWTLMAGRRNIPMYYYSEFSEVGYAYPWVRPPANLYWWQVTQFNGIHAMYNSTIGDYSSSVVLFYGNEYSYNNKEMNYYEQLYQTGASKVDEFWTNIRGLNWNISGDIFDVRLVYFKNDRDRTVFFPDGTSEIRTPFDQTFMGFGGSVNVDPFTLLFDWNHVKYSDARGTVFPTYLVSVVYTYQDYQPYISYSKADHERKNVPTKDLEEHFLLSYGVRYNFNPSAALKVQYDHFVDQGDKPTGWAYHGDSDTVSVAVDFVF